jgi:hypothetical protein
MHYYECPLTGHNDNPHAKCCNMMLISQSQSRRPRNARRNCHYCHNNCAPQQRIANPMIVAQQMANPTMAQQNLMAYGVTDPRMMNLMMGMQPVMTNQTSKLPKQTSNESSNDKSG